MWKVVIGYVLKALLVAAVAGAIWYGIDQVAGAFRERKQLRYDLDNKTAEAARIAEEKAAAQALASLLEQRNKAELLLRDAISKQAAERASKIQKELSNATTRLAEWKAGADADLARCLRMPLPRWLLDGASEAGPAGQLLRQADPAAGRTPADRPRAQGDG